jgi:DNA-binding SARP family transcriptional activator/DNA polymerase III delta prime subunit
MSGSAGPADHGGGAAASTAHMIAFHILGPLRVVVDGRELPITTRRQRALLVLLLMEVGRVVPAERLIDQLWDGTPPPQAAVTLRSYVSNVRQALGGSSGLGAALVTRGTGYALDVPADTVDAVRLSTGAQLGREHLRHGRPREALAVFDATLLMWNGDPLADIADHEVAQSTIAQLTETYLGAVEGRFEALLGVGRHLDALPGLERFTADHPLREEPRALLMLALYRAGRAPEALEVHRRFRALLSEELGIDPSARLDDLHQRILEHDASLAPPAPVLAAAPAAPEESASRIPGQSMVAQNPAVRVGAKVAVPPVIVGRLRELSLIGERLDQLAVRGAGALLLLAGEPGIGKTTLLDALERQARQQDIAVHHARSPAATGAPAFWLWSQVVESVAATLSDEALGQACSGSARPVGQLSPAIAERFGQSAPILGDDPQTLRFLLYEAVWAFLRQAAAEKPMVITLDDIQWADLPSLELISYLTPALATQPMLLVAAYRDLPTERTEALEATLATVSREDVASELVLTGLDRSDIADLMDALLGVTEDRGARESLVALLHERTGGNPFFVRQLARLLVEDGGRDLDQGRVPAPPGVRHVVARRLAGLSEAARGLLASAAVIGREFDLRAAASAAEMGMDDALDAFDEAARHGLVETATDESATRDRDRHFVHALVQEVVLDELPAGRTARLHARIATLLEREGSTNPDEVARHLWAARELVGAAAVPALVAAAEAAVAVYALEQAEVHLQHALELVRSEPTEDPSTELSLLLSLFRIIMTGRGWGHVDVRRVMDRAMELAEAGAYNDETAQLWWSLFFFLLDRNDPSYVQVADTLLEAIDDPAKPIGTAGAPAVGSRRRIGHASRAVVHLTSIFSALDRDDRDRAQVHLHTARRHIEAASPAELAAFDEHLHVMLLLIEGFWAALTGDQAGYRSTTDAAVALADADGRPFPRAVARTLGASSGPYLPDVTRVHDLARQALDLDQRFQFGWLASIAGCLYQWADAYVNGTSADAVRTAEALLAEVLDAGHLGNESILALLLADGLVLEGRIDQARTALLRARRNPGPYRAMVVEVVDGRLARLAREEG